MYSDIEISDAHDLVKGMAIAIRDNRLTLSEVHDFILSCTDNDERLTKVVVEKTLIHLECLEYQTTFSKAV